MAGTLSHRLPGLAEQVDAAAAAVGRHAGRLLALAAPPVALAEVAARSIALTDLRWGWAAQAAVHVVGVWLGAAAGVLLLGDAGLGRAPDLRSTLRRLRQRAGAVLVLLLRGLLGAALPLLVVLPGLRRLARTLVALSVLQLEGTGSGAALRRAGVLEQPRRDQALGVLVVALAVASAPALLLCLLVAAFVRAPVAGPALDLLRDALTRTACLTLLATVLAAVAFTCFVAQRQRLEGLDLQLALQDLAVRR